MKKKLKTLLGKDIDDDQGQMRNGQPDHLAVGLHDIGDIRRNDVGQLVSESNKLQLFAQ